MSATPADHLLMNRVAQNNLDMTNHFEQRCRHSRVPLVEPNGAVEITLLGIEVGGETRGGQSVKEKIGIDVAKVGARGTL